MRFVAALFLLVGLVLSPLHAVAATIPMLIVYDAAVGPTATTAIGTDNAVRSETGHSRITAYDDARFGYDKPSRPRLARGAGAFCTYDDALEHARAREVEGGEAIYDAPAATTAAAGGTALTRTAATDALNVLPSSGRIFVGTPGGRTVAIPAGWVGRVADSGSGLVFQEAGAARNANMIRIMDATPAAPSGYLRFYNRYGQPLDVLGEPGGRAATHIPLYFQGQIEWPW